VPLVAVGGDAAGGPLGIDHGPQSTVGVRRWRYGRIRACAEERVLFIGTQFSILYTFVYLPA